MNIIYNLQCITCILIFSKFSTKGNACEIPIQTGGVEYKECVKENQLLLLLFTLILIILY